MELFAYVSQEHMLIDMMNKSWYFIQILKKKLYHPCIIYCHEILYLVSVHRKVLFVNVKAPSYYKKDLEGIKRCLSKHKLSILIR
jgi:hypothetical protein